MLVGLLHAQVSCSGGVRSVTGVYVLASKSAMLGNQLPVAQERVRFLSPSNLTPTTQKAQQPHLPNSVCQLVKCA